jgi:hypothetical protein
MSAVEETGLVQRSEDQEDSPVSLQTTQLVAATPGASVSASRAEEGRTAEEKMDALDEANETIGEAPPFKSMHELAAGSQEELAAAVQQIIYVLERHFNIDFVREAPLSEVTSGIAAARAAMSPYKESPQMVDDAVVPPGVNNATDEILPPNIPAGEPIPGTEEAAEKEAEAQKDADARAEMSPEEKAADDQKKIEQKRAEQEGQATESKPQQQRQKGK